MSESEHLLPAEPSDTARSRAAVWTLRALLLVLFAIFVVVEVSALSGDLVERVDITRAVEGIETTALTVTVVVSLCVQVVIVCIWRLLGFVTRGEIFSAQARIWVDAIVVVVGGACLFLLAVLVLALADGRDPVWPVVLGLAATFTAVCALLMVVMRALLRRATELRTDMEAVV
ncbi:MULTISPECIES: DUF2975 domain-containing protein [Brevibacterium]|uniref:DUF2975 domain-containing protein n=1 Tax=Brevibacterium salitolerans TaxID=1403566 RepID=A0ABN2X543_9MICO|nr:DUF2975 domain-containing protein [Brevibacterium sp.]